MKISIIIPALNEEAGIEKVIDQIPKGELLKSGYEVEIIVVDNGSTDKTAEIAKAKEAQVVAQPLRGYGNAYRAGFAKATGNIIVTGDADMTYPFDRLPQLIEVLIANDWDFLNTDRLNKVNPAATTAYVHALGTWALSFIIRFFFNCPFHDSQSGMWIFKREIWKFLSVKSEGMSFSQEIKIEAFTKGFKCGEIPIEYRPRVGESKLSVVRDGLGAMSQILRKKFNGKEKVPDLSFEARANIEASKK
jgi:glycosyltransferase involved in cell wall biosynthesis